jgi:acyl-CoA thioester hydrolase
MSDDIPTSGRYENHEHLLPVRVYYEDTDFTGVVYHANYLRFFERGRSEFLRLMGDAEGMDGPGAFAITRIEVDYRAGARIHDALLIRTAFVGAKGARMTFEQRLERGGSLLCKAVVIAVPIHETGKVRRPSDAELALWARYTRPDASTAS